MIPYTSCICFGAHRAADRRRPWRLLTAQRGTDLVFEKNEDNSLCIRIKDEEEKEEEKEEAQPLCTVHLSGSESCLLEEIARKKPITLSSGGEMISMTGRRTRQPVITPVVDLNLLDDTYSGVTQILLSKCGNWAFNTFNLDVSTGGKSLSFLLVHLFHEYGFVSHFKLDVVKVWRCFNLMEAAYHRHNPYHNSVHAADVTQAMHCFLQENKFSAHLTPLEAMTSVIAAVAHDLDHPGVTQAFLVATSNHLVNLYQNSSVLENHHWRTAISCLRESGIFDHLEKEVWSEIQSQIRSLILATDITRQKEFLSRFKSYLNTRTLDMEKTQYRHFALQIALKCADLCNPCRPWAISQRWSYQVCQEFYRQGAYERQLQLPLTPTFDCSRTKVAKIQADFFQFVVSPLFETWDHFLETPLSGQLLRNLRHNYTQWKQKMEQMQRIQEAADGDFTEECTDPKINVTPPSLSSLTVPSSESKSNSSQNLLSPAEAGVIFKQHRSKSDSGLTPRLLSPNIQLEAYSTEELHPRTTLLSLSSSTNTVQLRKAYATTKVESHLICPTVFQPLVLSTLSPKRQQVSDKTNSVDNSIECSDQQDCESSCDEEPKKDTHELDADVQSPNSNTECPDGCCTPVLPAEVSRGEENASKELGQGTACDSQTNPSSLSSETISHHHHQLSDASSVQSSSLHGLKSTTSSVHADVHKYSLTNLPNRAYLPPLPRTPAKQPTTKTFTQIAADESARMTPSWCWHISRSLSAERPKRPSHEFDSPLPSWQGSNSSLSCSLHAGRRGSAPVPYCYTDGGGSQWSSLGEIVDTKGGLRGGAEESAGGVRRWSIPTEPIAGLLLAPDSSNFIESHGMVSTEAVRRHSFGLLEPLLGMPSSESENDGSSTGPTSTGTTCSTRRNSSAIGSQRPRKSYGSTNEPDDSTFNSTEVLLPCFPASPQTSNRRRGSLPVEIPIALMRQHVTSPSRHHLPKTGFDETRIADVAERSREARRHSLQCGGVHHPRRQGPPSDLLSVLLGPAGMLNAVQGMVYGGPPGTEWPRSSAQDFPRRRSGGLEMLSGLWRSRTCDPPAGAGFAGRVKLQRQLLDDWVLWGRGEDFHRRSPVSPNRGAGITALSQQLLYQQRRGSVPLDISLLSLSSGNTYSGDQGD